MKDKLQDDPVINRQLQFVEWLKENKMYNEWASSTQMQAMHRVWEKLYPPKHETVEQWETRTGETYPDDSDVWSWEHTIEAWVVFPYERYNEICEEIDGSPYVFTNTKPDSVGGE